MVVQVAVYAHLQQAEDLELLHQLHAQLLEVTLDLAHCCVEVVPCLVLQHPKYPQPYVVFLLALSTPTL